MRGLLVMTLFAVSLSHATWRDFKDVRELEVDASSVTSLRIDAGAGALEVKGVEGADRIFVTATIEIENTKDEEAHELMERYLLLSLAIEGDQARLDAGFERGIWPNRHNARVNLEVQVPESLALVVEDSSGSIRIADMIAPVKVDDSSGSIDVFGSGDLDIEDGSGSIDVEGVAGDLRIDDGSGSINVRNVKGSVYIDDGSGSISVRHVDRDLVVTNAGSGSLSYANVGGVVEGDIED
ncbi:MAG: hypothetical protein QNJ07_11095 [Woeseiaceae bacterium]|nr:hypothetical protein [Woeseiaceae bacterium]